MFQSIVQLLAEVFNLPPDDKTFILDEYLPTLRYALKDLKVSSFTKLRLGMKLVGTLMKFGFAFAFQGESI